MNRNREVTYNWKSQAILLIGALLLNTNAYGWGLKDVFNNLHTNTTNPGNYHDAAAGYWSGGSSMMRTKGLRIAHIQLPNLRHHRLMVDELITQEVSNFAELKLESAAVSVGNFLSEMGIEGFNTRTFEANRLKESKAYLSMTLEASLTRIWTSINLKQYQVQRWGREALLKDIEEKGLL